MQLKLPTISPHILQENHIDVLSQLLTGMRFGLEKEGLRVDWATGQLAQTPHPRDLGSALTHPHITTDYSEALLEFVTGTHASPHAAIQELEEKVYEIVQNSEDITLAEVQTILFKKEFLLDRNPYFLDDKEITKVYNKAVWEKDNQEEYIGD